MNLTPEVTAYVLNAVKTARLVDIDSVIIEPDTVRGMDDSNSVVLFQDEDVLDMPFGSIGMTRLDSLVSRYDIASSHDKFSVEANVRDGEDFAGNIVMKSKGIKVDYRCGNPTKIRAPRQINDTMLFGVQLNEEAVNLLQKGATAMKADQVTIISNDDGVSFEMADVNNDVFKHTFADNVEILDDEENTKFAHRYPIKILQSLFKHNSEGSFSIGAKGMLSFPINGLTVYVLPQV